MKKKLIKYIAIFATGILILSSCEKDYDNFITKVTYYADIEYEPTVLVELGGSYTPTATATEAGENLEVNISGASSIDFNSVGIYNVSYSAVNSDGYAGSVVQQVIVHNPNGVGIDVSGNIQDIGRPERKAVISLVKGTTNLYYCTDMAFGGIFPLYFEMNGDEMHIVKQTFALGVQEVEASYDPATKTFHTNIIDYGFTYDFEYYTE